jgi:L-aminopeptidase/D-esterase-like protein
LVHQLRLRVSDLGAEAPGDVGDGCGAIAQWTGLAGGAGRSIGAVNGSVSSDWVAGVPSVSRIRTVGWSVPAGWPSVASRL